MSIEFKPSSPPLVNRSPGADMGTAPQMTDQAVAQLVASQQQIHTTEKALYFNVDEMAELSARLVELQGRLNRERLSAAEVEKINQEINVINQKIQEMAQAGGL